MSWKKPAAAIALSLIVASCATPKCEPVYVSPPPLPVPEKPATTDLTDKELECLSNETYGKVVGEIIQLETWGKKCQAILKSTHQ